jgi:hypothetical protein
MSSYEFCTQPQCILQEKDFDQRAIAELLVRLAAGDDVSDVVAGRSPIQAYERCTKCAQRCIEGLSPLPTADKLQALLEAGQLSHRRRRRKRKDDDRAANR